MYACVRACTCDTQLCLSAGQEHSLDRPEMADAKITKEDVALAQGPVNAEANGQIPKGSLAAKLQQAEAKGRTVGQTVQSLREAPGVSVEQDTVPPQLAEKLQAGQPQ